MAAAAVETTGARAQTPDAMALCRAIADDARRLACYDGLDISTASPRSKYARVPLDELKIDSLSYRGRFVEVAGMLIGASGGLALAADAADARPFPLDIGGLPRQERTALIEACEMGCEVIVQGRVNPVRFTTGIVADKVIRR